MRSLHLRNKSHHTLNARLISFSILSGTLVLYIRRMSSTPQPTSNVAARACPKCGDPLVTGKPYCANCGLLIGASPDTVALHAYVDAKVSRELDSRIKENGGVVRELADQVEDVVWGRLKRYTVIAGLFLAVIAALLTFIGFKTYDDLKNSVLKQIQPAVSQIEKRASDIGVTVDDLRKNRIPAVTSSLNQVEGEAQSQKERVEGADGQIAKSMQSLRTAESKATADSEQFERSVKENKLQLDQITQRSKEQIAQVTQAASQASVVQAYPMIGQEPQILISNQLASIKEKKPGEMWVSLVVSYSAIRENTYTTEQIKQVESALRLAGYRVFTGTVQVTGRLGVGFERIGPDLNGQDSAIFYYDKQKDREADDIWSLVSKHVQTLGPRPVLVSGSSIGFGFGAGIRYFEENSVSTLRCS